jgi:hypothetical protein
MLVGASLSKADAYEKVHKAGIFLKDILGDSLVGYTIGTVEAQNYDDALFEIHQSNWKAQTYEGL